MSFFEGDAWGTSYRQGLEWIIQNDERDSIIVSFIILDLEIGI